MVTYMNSLDKKIWCFWMGGELTTNRSDSLKSLKNNSECNINLVTHLDIKEYEIDSSPIHPAFEYLSAVHKSAYLRSYFMYHYGGGYSDVKRCDYSWIQYFKKLSNSEYDFIGYYEKSPNGIYGTDEMKIHATKFVGNGKFIFKKNTSFAKEWLFRTNRVLDDKYDSLKQNPGWYHQNAVTGGIQGMSNHEFDKQFNHKYKTYNYPIGWGELMGKIFHMMQFEEISSCKKLSFTGGMPFINMKDYR